LLALETLVKKILNIAAAVWDRNYFNEARLNAINNQVGIYLL